MKQVKQVLPLVGAHQKTEISDPGWAEDRQVCEIPASLLGKGSFVDPENGVRGSDDRNRVWKIWSRIAEEASRKELERVKLGNPLTKLDEFMFHYFLKPMMKSARHFVLPKSVDKWDHDTFYKMTRPNGDAEHLDLIQSMFETFVMPFDVCAMHLPGEGIGLVCRVEEVAGNDIDRFFSDSANRTNPWLSDTNGYVGNWFVAVIFPVEQSDPKAGYEQTHSCLEVGLLNINGDALEESFENGTNLPYAVAPLYRADLITDGRVVDMWACFNADNDDEFSPLNEVGDSSQLVFDLLVSIQSYKKFIVRVDPSEKVRKRSLKAKKAAEIKPISERPVYLSLEPQAIREELGIPKVEGEHGKRAPHERRAHYRMLRSDRFTWKRGEIVPVKASWIGPASGTTNQGREYRVLLDKASPTVRGAADG